MPDADGLTLAATIRETAELSATRIILLTSGDRPGDLARFRELRIDAHLLKPVQQDELLETIYQVMSLTTERMKDQGGRMKGDKKSVSGSDSFILHPSSFPRRILVAEDNEFSARLLEHLLTRRGHHVRLASNGREALTLAEEGAFDLLLLDVHMPELDGFQVVQALRDRERTEGGHLPVIALTARSRKEDRAGCLAAGMDDFLTKPVPTAGLFAAIDRLVSTHGVSRPAHVDVGERRSLLDPIAVLRACGNDADGLRRMCEDFRTYMPARLAEVGDALRSGDGPRLRQAAHKLCALLSAFSTAAGNLASDLEDLATEGQVAEARPLVEQLQTMAEELLQLAGGLSLETLRHQAGTADKANWTTDR
jgi:CheY-like chemotaxis protein